MLYVLIFTLDWLNIHLTQKTQQSLYRCKYSLFNSQNAKCLVIEVVSILQFISLTHYLHEMIQWAIYSLIVKQVFPFQFWHALLVLCTPLSSAQWSYAEIRQKKSSDKNYSGSSLDWHSCKWTVLLNVAPTKNVPYFSTPTQTLYFCIPVSGQLQFQLLFHVLRVSAYESFHCKMFLFLKSKKETWEILLNKTKLWKLEPFYNKFPRDWESVIVRIRVEVSCR